LVTPSTPLDPQLFTHPLTLVVKGEVTEARQGKRELPLTKKGDKTVFDFDPNGGIIMINLKE
jgi:hypothetical protein